MSAFAWWEWVAFAILVLVAYVLGYSAGRYQGRLEALTEHRDAMLLVAKRQEQGAQSMRIAIDKLCEVVDAVRRSTAGKDRCDWHT